MKNLIMCSLCLFLKLSELNTRHYDGALEDSKSNSGFSDDELSDTTYTGENGDNSLI